VLREGGTGVRITAGRDETGRQRGQKKKGGEHTKETKERGKHAEPEGGENKRGEKRKQSARN